MTYIPDWTETSDDYLDKWIICPVCYRGYSSYKYTECPNCLKEEIENE